MLMSDANKVLSGRKRGLGAIHGIISLAVILFGALSAQSNAKIFVRCVPEKTTFFPSGTELEYGRSGLPFLVLLVTTSARDQKQ